MLSFAHNTGGVSFTHLVINNLTQYSIITPIYNNTQFSISINSGTLNIEYLGNGSVTGIICIFNISF